MFDIRRLEDINIQEVKLKQKYYEYFINGNIDNAHQLIEDNPSLKFKVINAENLNKIIEHILNLEGKYYENIENVLLKSINKYQISIDNLIYLEDFKESIQYEINNFVLYNNEIYYCYIKPPIGTLPINSTYWIYLGLKGEDSYPNLSINYRGNWNSNIDYFKYDAVVYQTKLYVAKIDNSNKIPYESINEWSLQMSVQNQGIYVSEIEPPSLKEGNIWVEIL